MEERCKMYRFTDSQWKERATGIVKVLHNEKKGTYRVVTRRDQVSALLDSSSNGSVVAACQMVLIPQEQEGKLAFDVQVRTGSRFVRV